MSCPQQNVFCLIFYLEQGHSQDFKRGCSQFWEFQVQVERLVLKTVSAEHVI